MVHEIIMSYSHFNQLRAVEIFVGTMIKMFDVFVV